MPNGDHKPLHTTFGPVADRLRKTQTAIPATAGYANVMRIGIPWHPSFDTDQPDDPAAAAFYRLAAQSPYLCLGSISEDRTSATIYPLIQMAGHPLAHLFTPVRVVARHISQADGKCWLSAVPAPNVAPAFTQQHPF